MNKRTHMQFIPAMLLSACILAGCSESTGMEDTTLPEMLPEPQAKLELKLHLDSAIQTGSENDYITAFAKLHPEVTLIVEDYSEIPRPDYRKKLAAELMAGEGPDVIVNSNYLGTNSMENLTKLLQNDVFLDISELSVNLDGCSAAVMEAGMFEGRQYQVPLNYSLSFLITSEERIKAYELVIDKTLVEFADSVGNIYEAEKAAFPYYFDMRHLYRQNALDIIDYQDGSLTEEAEDIMLTFADAFADLFPGLYDGRAAEYQFSRKQLKNYNHSLYNAVASGDLVLYGASDFIGQYESLSCMERMLQSFEMSGETPVLFSMPTIDGKPSAPAVNYSVLVNANTANREASALFVETMIGTDTQFHIFRESGIPVNNVVMEIIRRRYIDDIIDPVYKLGSQGRLPEKMRAIAKVYFASIDTMRPGVHIDYTTGSHLSSLFAEDAAGGGRSAYTSMKSTVERYLQE